jgi:transcriptional regulator with GAF, ATPase, and Fis domain
MSVDQPSIVGWVMENAEMTVAEAGKDSRHHKEFEKGMKLKSNLIFAFPLILRDGQVYGVVQLIDTNPSSDPLNVDKKYLELLKGIVDMGAMALSNALYFSQQVEKTLELEQTLAGMQSDVQLIGQSRPFIEVMKQVRDYAATNFPVLITGESGTGKDLVAMALHNSVPGRINRLLCKIAAPSRICSWKVNSSDIKKVRSPVRQRTKSVF